VSPRADKLSSFEPRALLRKCGPTRIQKVSPVAHNSALVPPPQRRRRQKHNIDFISHGRRRKKACERDEEM